MTIRREFLIAFGASALAAPLASFAQQSAAKVARIGFLGGASAAAYANRVEAFKAGLRELGYIEGRNIAIEYRWADGRYDRLPSLAEELVTQKPSILVAGTSMEAIALAKAAPKTPIVNAGGDPLATGLVSNLARPGGMITGVTSIITQVNEKHLEVLLDAVPKLRRVGFLGDSNIKSQAIVIEAARRSLAQHSVEGRFAEVASAGEIEPAILRLAKEGTQALVVLSGPLLTSERQRIVKLVLVQRWPLIVGQSEWAEAGALLTYGADRSALYRRVAYYVDRILKGTKPGDLPMEQPTKFELVVNMKTAKALGLTIPQPFLMRADKVIE